MTETPNISNVLNEFQPAINGDNYLIIKGTHEIQESSTYKIAGVEVINKSTLASKLNNLEAGDAVTGITAKAGGGQTTATALTGEFNNVTIVVSDFDSVKLPSVASGGKVVIKNSSANILSVFPFLADSINAMAVNKSVDIPPGGEITFRGISAVIWETIESMYLSAPTTQKGGIVYKSADNAGNTLTEVVNASQAGDRVYTIPDAGENAEFVMDTDIADFIKMLGIKDITGVPSAGTWTITRVAQADYVLRKTQGDDTSIIGIDITEILRTTALKGFKLASFDLIFRNNTLDLDAHTITLDKIVYVNSVAPAITSVPLTATLPVGQDADPQVYNVSIDTPAFLIDDDAKYVMELTVDAGATSDYDFIGVMLKFTQNNL